MQCERLTKMIKSWYLHVRDETMAPARMVAFMEEHAESCDVCLQDPDLKDEIAKITELVLPQSKIPKAVRQKKAQDEEREEAVVEDEEETDGEETDGEETDDENQDETEVDEEDIALDDDPELLGTPDV